MISLLIAIPARAELNLNCDQTCTSQIEKMVPLRETLSSLSRQKRLEAIEEVTHKAMDSSHEDVRLFALELLTPNSKSMRPSLRSKSMDAILKVASGSGNIKVESLALDLLLYSAHSPLEMYFLKGIDSVEKMALRSTFSHIKYMAVQELSLSFNQLYSAKAQGAILRVIGNLSKY